MDWTAGWPRECTPEGAIPVALAFFAVFVLVLILLLLVWSGVVGTGTGLIFAAAVALAALLVNALTRWSTDA